VSSLDSWMAALQTSNTGLLNENLQSHVVDTPVVIHQWAVLLTATRLLQSQQCDAMRRTDSRVRKIYIAKTQVQVLYNKYLYPKPQCN
jgi:hypothetical protein